MNFRFVACAALAAFCACQGSKPLSTPAPSPPEFPAGVFERIAVIGASASAGFNLQFEVGQQVRFGDFIDQAVLVPHAVVYDGASEMLFMAPEMLGPRMVAEAQAANPSVVIAPDFLFWFFYGEGETVEKRRARLENGLALLEGFNCPIVIGELPDMRAAAGRMIPLSAMPPRASFAGANQRLRAWADSRGNVAVVPLVELNAKLQSGEPITLGEYTWDPNQRGDLLQADRLHPTMAGSAVLCLKILGQLAKLEGGSLAGVVQLDPERLTDDVDDLVSAR